METKKATNELPWEVTSIIPGAEWLGKHPALEKALMWIMCAACFGVVLTYNFTTHI